MEKITKEDIGRYALVKMKIERVQSGHVSVSWLRPLSGHPDGFKLTVSVEHSNIVELCKEPTDD